MYYRINIEDGYIHGVAKGVSFENSNATEDEYNRIVDIIKNTPTAPDGVYYRLRENLEWELFELPPFEDEEMATETDYREALESLGVNFNA